MKLSVLICTHNPRADYLHRVLESLRAQTLKKEQWELLLVDNGSEHALHSRIDLSWHPHSRHIREEVLGLTPARLRGISEAATNLLVFADDDTVLNTDYLEQALAVSTGWPFVGAWGGSCIPEYEKPLPGWVGDDVWRLTVVEVKEDIWSNLRENFITFPCGAGLCVRRAVGEAYFQRCANNRHGVTLDRRGSNMAGYGDVDLSYCALDIGMGTGKSTRLKLTHLIPENRLTLDYFVRQAEGDAESMVQFRANRNLPIPKPVVLSWLQRLRWFCHRLKNNIPNERYEIQKAHYRGLLKGYRHITKVSF